MSLVFENGPKNSSDRFVLLALADFANDNNECWPAVPTIAKRCALSDRTVTRSISNLEKDGYITVKRMKGKQSRYFITPDKMSPPPDTVSPPPLTESQGTPDTVSPKPLINHNIEPSVNYYKDFPEYLLDEHIYPIFQDITGLPTIPNSANRPPYHVLDDIRRLRSNYKTRDELIEDAKKYWEAWNERGYQKNNNNWMDWWIAGQIPKKPKQAEEAQNNRYTPEQIAKWKKQKEAPIDE